MIGRVHRHPQQKVVLIYRLVVRNFPDVFLSSLSFQKGAMHSAFTKGTLSKPIQSHKLNVNDILSS